MEGGAAGGGRRQGRQKAQGAEGEDKAMKNWLASIYYLEKEMADCQRDIAARKIEITRLSREQIKDKIILDGLQNLLEICKEKIDREDKE